MPRAIAAEFAKVLDGRAAVGTSRRGRPLVGDPLQATDSAPANASQAQWLAEIAHHGAIAARVHREIQREAECEDTGVRGVVARARRRRLPDCASWLVGELLYRVAQVTPGVVMIRGRLRLTYWGHFARIAFALAVFAFGALALTVWGWHAAGVSPAETFVIHRPLARSAFAVMGKYHGRHWGAKPEATNALPGLDALFDAAKAASDGTPCEIFLAPGTYATNGAWILSDGTQPQGSKGLIGCKLSAYGATIVSSVMTAKVTRFEDWIDCTIDGLGAQHSNATSRLGDGYACAAMRCKDTTWQRCRFTRVSAQGFHADACTRVNVNDCTVGWNYADGIHFAGGCWGCGASDNRIFYPGDDGVVAFSQEDGVENPELDALGDLYPSWARDMSFTGNRIYGMTSNGGRGVVFVGCRGGTATGNVTDSLAYAGILVFCDRTSGRLGYGNTDIVMTGNTFISGGQNVDSTYAGAHISTSARGTDGNGVDIRANKRIKISDNLFYNHLKAAGIRVTGAGNVGVYCSDNTISGGGNHNGIEADSGADLVFFTDNDVILLGKSGYVIEDTVLYCSIRGGTVYKPNQNDNNNTAWGVDNSALAGTITDVDVIVDTTLTNTLKGNYNVLKFTVKRLVPSFKTVTTNYTVTPLDFGRILRCTAAAVVTFPAFDSTYDIPQGSSVVVWRDTSSAVSIANDGTSTIVSRGSLTSVGSQSAAVQVFRTNTSNQYLGVGDLA